jgi:hypothetical protein
MTFGIEEDPHRFLRLVVRHRRAQCDSRQRGGIEVVDGHVQMHHHLLFAFRSRPGWGLEVIVPLKTDEGRRARYGNRCPILIVLRYRPAKHEGVKGRESIGVSGVNAHSPPLRFQTSVHNPILQASFRKSGVRRA